MQSLSTNPPKVSQPSDAFALVLTGPLRTVATGAIEWLAATVLANGTLPLVAKSQNRSAAVNPTALLSYAAEAVVATHVAMPSLRPLLVRSFEPSVRYLVNSQLPNGSWPFTSKDERIRAARAVTLLSWLNSSADGETAAGAASALRRFSDMLLQAPDAYGVKKDIMLAGFAGLAACDIVSFGVSFA